MRASPGIQTLCKPLFVSFFGIVPLAKESHVTDLGSKGGEIHRLTSCWGICSVPLHGVAVRRKTGLAVEIVYLPLSSED